MRTLILLLFALVFFAGCNFIDKSRMGDTGDPTPWNTPADWETAPIMSN